MSFFAFLRLVRARVFREYLLRAGGRYLRLDASHFDTSELDAWVAKQVTTEGAPFDWKDNPAALARVPRLLAQEPVEPAEEDRGDDRDASAEEVASRAGLTWPLGAVR